MKTWRLGGTAGERTAKHRTWYEALSVLLACIIISPISIGEYTRWSGTTIFGVISKHEIVLGADSRATADQPWLISDGYCKVYVPTRGLAFAVCGITRVGAIFDLPATIIRNCRHRGGYEEEINRSTRSLCAFLLFYDHAMRIAHPQVLDTLVNRMFFEVIYCTSCGSHVRSDALTYKISRSPAGRDSVVVERCSCVTKDWPEGQIKYIAAGYTESIQSWLRCNVSYPCPGDRSEFITRMIKLEFASHPVQVGGSVDIVRVSGNGISWLTPNRDCGDR